VLRDFNPIGVTLLIASRDEALLARYTTRTPRLVNASGRCPAQATPTARSDGRWTGKNQEIAGGFRRL